MHNYGLNNEENGGNKEILFVYKKLYGNMFSILLENLVVLRVIRIFFGDDHKIHKTHWPRT